MRERCTALLPIALSPARLAKSLGIRVEVVNDAIQNDLLPCVTENRAMCLGGKR
jgi:hypothetical protein